VEDASLVGVVDRLGDLAEDAGRLARGERPAPQAAVERAAGDELLGDERAAVGRPGVVHGHDPGVAETGRRLGLALEPREGPRVEAREDLEGDLAVDAGVPGPVDDRGRSLAEDLSQGVAGELAERRRLGGARARGRGVGRWLLGRGRVGAPSRAG